MKQTDRIQLLAACGSAIKSDLENNALDELYFRCENENPWFVKPFVEFALRQVSTSFLNQSELENWVAPYAFNQNEKTVALVPAGNIPLVGLHDLLAVFVSGHKALVKPSSKDKVLLSYILQILSELEPSIAEHVQLNDRLQDFDAVIATGSNNTNRYFEYYFAKYPNILRRNRTSAAIIPNDTAEESLDALCDDIALYFGLGCRSVAKLYMQEGFAIERLLEKMERYSWMGDHHKFHNNYMYQKSVYLVNSISHFDTGTLLLRENDALHSPVSTLYFEYFSDKNALAAMLEKWRDDLQVVVGNFEKTVENSVQYGFSQQTTLRDYADGIDTLAFLSGL
ncbi:acyl-CoA reductase [bacterium]|nr:acyl-CoA reductase [bacterium]